MVLDGLFSMGPLRVLVYFVERPFGEFYLREVSRNTGLSVFAVKKYCDLLVLRGLITEFRRGNMRYFKANIDNLFFRGLKSGLNADRIMKSGVVEYILEHTPNTSSITLYGSMAEGLNDEKSDVDIMVIGSKKNLNMHEYEEILDSEIQIQTMTWSEWQKKAEKDKPFYNEVISKGISLYGQKPVIT